MTAAEFLDGLDAARAEATVAFPWRQDSGWGEDIITADGDQFGATGHPADAALIVAAVNALPKLTAAVRAVLDVHGAIDAVQYLGARQVPRRVCTGCGSDDGNWQLWPCPTVTAITAALAGAS